MAGVFLCATGLPALSQSDTGEIDLSVVDAASQQPLGNARTILLGAQTANSLTTASGEIRFTDVPVGIYRVRVSLRGYDPGNTREFDVLGDRSVHVRIELSKRATGPSTGTTASTGASSAETASGLRTIAVVSARSKISITTTDLDANSPMRRLSDSLTDALDKLAGVSVTTDSTDPTSAVQISLHNQDESQTALTLDGIPLSAPGSAGNLRGIGTDLFSGTSVSFGPSAGGLAGGVNFSTLQPTQALQFRANGTTGTFDRSNYAFATTGSIDKLGFVLEHTDRTANSPLTFQDFEDQSGLTYPHGGESSSLSDLVKVRYSLGDERTSITATALDTNRNAYAICAQDVANLPCGIGPNNRTFGRYAMAYSSIQSLVGNVQTTFAAYANSSTQAVDDLSRFILEPDGTCPQNELAGGAPIIATDFTPSDCPSLIFTNTVTRGVAYSASIAQGNHTFSLTGNTYAALNISDPVLGSQFATGFTNAAASSTYKFADAIKSNDELTLTPSVSFADTSGIGGSFLAGFNTTWTPKTADAYSFAVNVGSSQPNLSAIRAFSDPSSARFNCDAQTAVVSGPGDTGNGQKQSAAAFNASWAHQFQGGASLSLSAFSQVQSGQLISALIEEPNSFYPAGFLDTVFSAYHAPSVCGATAPAPAVFVQESVAGTRRIYQGFDLSGRFALSPYVEVLPTYSLNLAVLTAASARLDDGPSTTVVGQQLPNRPLHRGGITFDGLLPRSGIELLANAQYTGANNQQNIGPYVNVSFGVSHRFGPGQMTLFENNAFNTYAGDFASDSFAQPLALSTGGTYLTAATPLTPRTIFLSYAVVVGGPAPGPAFRFARGSRLAQAAAPEPSPSPSANPRRGQRAFTSNPPPPGVDPLSLATTRDTCDAQAQSIAQPIYAALKTYVAAYEGNTKLPDVPNTTIVAHRTSVDPTVPYYLELRTNFPRPPGAGAGGEGGGRRGGAGGGFGGGGPGGPGGPGGGGPPGDGPPPAGGADVVGSSNEATAQAQAARRNFANSPVVRGLRAFIGCAYVTILSADDAKAKGIAPEGGRFAFYYVPKIGLLFVQARELPQGGGSLKPAASPAPDAAATAAPAPPH